MKTSPNRFCAAALALAFSTLGCIDDRPLTVADSGAGAGGTAGSGGRNGGVDGASDGFGTSTGILLTPNSIGYYDGTNLAGVVGAWYAFGDYYDGGGVLAMPGMGSCPKAGFAKAQCSTVTTPTASALFVPDSNGKGMCTSGIAAKAIGLDGGPPDYADIWGAGIGFDLNPGEASGGVGVKGQYDAPTHGITGIAFNIDTVPVGGGFASRSRPREPRTLPPMGKCLPNINCRSSRPVVWRLGGLRSVALGGFLPLPRSTQPRSSPSGLPSRRMFHRRSTTASASIR